MKKADPKEKVHTCIAIAHDSNEAIRIKLLLNRASIPYTVRNEQLFNIYGAAGALIFGPMRFMIPSELKAEAEAALQDVYEIDPASLPERCPACNAPTLRTQLDCPSCGLFLG